MKKLIFSTFLIFVGSILFSQNNRYIAFCAKESGVGHAFVSLGREDINQQMTIHDGTWGMYPKESAAGAKSIVIGEVPGEIRDDLLTNPVYTFVVIVNENEYNKALEIVDKWKSKNYELLRSDCLSFTIEVANVLKDKIIVPDRAGFENLPAKYLQELIARNN